MYVALFNGLVTSDIRILVLHVYCLEIETADVPIIISERERDCQTVLRSFTS